MKNKLFETDTELVIKFGGKKFYSIEYAKTDALTSILGIPEPTARELALDAQKAAEILLWQPDGPADKPAPAPNYSDSQILAACNDAPAKVPLKIAKARLKLLGWTFERATTELVRSRTVKPKPAPPANLDETITQPASPA